MRCLRVPATVAAKAQSPALIRASSNVFTHFLGMTTMLRGRTTGMDTEFGEITVHSDSKYARIQFRTHDGASTFVQGWNSVEASQYPGVVARLL